jgi:hypothetical protein
VVNAEEVFDETITGGLLDAATANSFGDASRTAEQTRRHRVDRPIEKTDEGGKYGIECGSHGLLLG